MAGSANSQKPKPLNSGGKSQVSIEQELTALDPVTHLGHATFRDDRKRLDLSERTQKFPELVLSKEMRQVAQVNLIRVLGILVDDGWRATTKGLGVDAVDGNVVFGSPDFEGLILEADTVK
jgi:hypothetical protein